MVEITAPPEILAGRLAARGREDEAQILERLQRSVPIPTGCVVATIMNDATIEKGAAGLIAALRGLSLGF